VARPLASRSYLLIKVRNRIVLPRARACTPEREEQKRRECESQSHNDPPQAYATGVQ
jgi:hypothetical protein